MRVLRGDEPHVGGDPTWAGADRAHMDRGVGAAEAGRAAQDEQGGAEPHVRAVRLALFWRRVRAASFGKRAEPRDSAAGGAFLWGSLPHGKPPHEDVGAVHPVRARAQLHLYDRAHGVGRVPLRSEPVRRFRLRRRGHPDVLRRRLAVPVVAGVHAALARARDRAPADVYVAKSASTRTRRRAARTTARRGGGLRGTSSGTTSTRAGSATSW